MNQHIALLRAINVGGHTVKMDRLCALFAELGFAGVETFIASGNVRFLAESHDPAALEQQIAAHLRAALGYAVATFLRSPAELAAITAHAHALIVQRAHTGTLYVALLHAAPDHAAQERIAAARSDHYQLHQHGREIYCLHQATISASGFSGAQLERMCGAPITMRNFSTMRKLAAKYAAL